MDNELIERFYERLGVRVDFDLIEEVVMSDANILRPVIGHAFEYLVEDIVLNKLGGKVIDAGGDYDVDLIVVDKNEIQHETQIKTLKNSDTKPNKSFAVSLHKTHGLEHRPNSLYPTTWPCPICKHSGGNFPDFLIAPHPQGGIMIIPKHSIPESKTFSGHFADPAVFDWNSPWLNRWDLLGFPEFKGCNLERTSVPEQPILNKICQRVKLTYEELLNLWLKPSNFRMIDMNLKGNLREPALRDFLEKNGLKTTPPTGSYPKYDLCCEDVKIQIKGPSSHKTNPKENLLGVEVMGSHGKGEKRRYTTSDFDYLGIAIEPQCLNANLPLDHESYHFVFIPIEDLPLHYRNGFEWASANRLYDVANFKVVVIEGEVYLKPNSNYRKPPTWKDAKGNLIIREPVHFRNNNMYKLDYIPLDLRKK